MDNARVIQLQGHLLDTGLLNRAFDIISEGGCEFEVLHMNIGVRKDAESTARIRVESMNPRALEETVVLLVQEGADLVDSDRNVLLQEVKQDGVAPGDFYCTTIYPTDVRVEGEWTRVQAQRMDAMVVVSKQEKSATARCVLMRDLKSGEHVVCGIDGIRTHTASRSLKVREEFAFMSSGVSSERRVETTVDQLAEEMRAIRKEGGKIVVVAGPVVVHTGGGAYLASLIKAGYVQVLLGGNAIAVHDMEQSIFGTSLGVDLARGVGVHEGHKHHLRVINTIRECGSIRAAVDQGVVQTGIMFECIRHDVPFVLAGSIRDDGPLPETMMDLVVAQREYARALDGASMVLMLSSMLHAIGTGNMTPAGVKLVCVDISPSVVTKLADRGSVESVGIVTDVGLFLNLLTQRLGCAGAL